MSDKKPIETSTEEKIFNAAREIFHQKGFDGARMQEIANKANINKSMLHYYYRSKDKLFEKVYQLSLIRVFPQIVSLLNKDLPLEEKLHRFVKEYLYIIKKNPDIPSFIFRELNSNPMRIQEFFQEQIVKRVQPFIAQIEEASARGEIIGDLSADQVIINIMSLIIFPFVGKPILRVLFNMDDTGFENFVEKRLDYLPDYVVRMTLVTRPPKLEP